MNSQESRQPFFSIPIEELEKYRGKWIAFSEDRGRVIAAAEDLSHLEELLAGMGENPEILIFDRIEDEDIFLGGAEGG